MNLTQWARWGCNLHLHYPNGQCTEHHWREVGQVPSLYYPPDIIRECPKCGKRAGSWDRSLFAEARGCRGDSNGGAGSADESEQVQP